MIKGSVMEATDLKMACTDGRLASCSWFRIGLLAKRARGKGTWAFLLVS